MSLRQQLTTLIEKQQAASQKLADLAIKLLETVMDPGELEQLKKEAAEWAKVKNLNLDELKAKAQKYDAFKEMLK